MGIRLSGHQVETGEGLRGRVESRVALLFRSSPAAGFDMVYRRQDMGSGWVEPEHA